MQFLYVFSVFRSCKLQLTNQSFASISSSSHCSPHNSPVCQLPALQSTTSLLSSPSSAQTGNFSSSSTHVHQPHLDQLEKENRLSHHLNVSDIVPPLSNSQISQLSHLNNSFSGSIISTSSTSTSGTNQENHSHLPKSEPCNSSDQLSVCCGSSGDSCSPASSPELNLQSNFLTSVHNTPPIESSMSRNGVSLSPSTVPSAAYLSSQMTTQSTHFHGQLYPGSLYSDGPLLSVFSPSSAAAAAAAAAAAVAGSGDSFSAFLPGGPVDALTAALLQQQAALAYHPTAHSASNTMSASGHPNSSAICSSASSMSIAALGEQQLLMERMRRAAAAQMAANHAAQMVVAAVGSHRRRKARTVFSDGQLNGLEKR